ncbi:MAG: hypothetical protein PWQ08_205 [Clostridiales bacterium]|jgi:hypothetical protein|nr:hypothetical protein [Clostridiales bacterium]
MFPPAQTRNTLKPAHKAVQNGKARIEKQAAMRIFRVAACFWFKDATKGGTAYEVKNA